MRDSLAADHQMRYRLDPILKPSSPFPFGRTCSDVQRDFVERRREEVAFDMTNLSYRIREIVSYLENYETNAVNMCEAIRSPNDAFRTLFEQN
jgi:hypothetical protein